MRSGHETDDLNLNMMQLKAATSDTTRSMEITATRRLWLQAEGLKNELALIR